MNHDQDLQNLEKITGFPQNQDLQRGREEPPDGEPVPLGVGEGEALVVDRVAHQLLPLLVHDLSPAVQRGYHTRSGLCCTY